MNALGFAWRSLVRQPARATLGVLGVAAVGALLFDMLLLSQGLVISMRDLLERTGFDIRVTATDTLPGQGPDIRDAVAARASIATLPSVRSAIAMRFEDADVRARRTARSSDASLQGVGGRRTTSVDDPSRARHLAGQPRDRHQREHVATRWTSSPAPRSRCARPAPTARGAAAGRVPRQRHRRISVRHARNGRRPARPRPRLPRRAARGRIDRRTFMVVTSTGDADAAAADIAALRPGSACLHQRPGGRPLRARRLHLLPADLHGADDRHAVVRAAADHGAAHRLGEPAARRNCRAACPGILALARRARRALRIGADRRHRRRCCRCRSARCWRSGSIGILKRMPGIPAELHFFVFEPQALWMHVVLLAATAIIAALYPMRIVARLPIAATLRDEVIG